MNKYLGEKDRSSQKYRIYVSGILPGTGKHQIMSYFRSFGSVVDVDFSDRHHNCFKMARPMKHYCILKCQDSQTFYQILNCTKHFIENKRVFCEEHLTGTMLIKQNNLNNKKRVFIRKIPSQVDIDQLLEFIETNFGSIESYMDFKDDKGSISNHFSISITFANKETRDLFFNSWERKGLKLLDEYVIVEKYSRNKQKINKIRNTSHLGEGSIPSWSLSNLASQNTLQKPDTSFSARKGSNFKLGVDSTCSAIATRQVIQLEHPPIPFTAPWNLLKPTSKGYHLGRTTSPQMSGHVFHNIRINMLIPHNHVNFRPEFQVIE